MRLFAAIGLDKQAQNACAKTLESLRLHTTSGRFIRAENLHLTLAFLGETSRVDAAKSALESVKLPRFTLVLQGMERFRRSGGDLYWMGVQENASLLALHDALHDALRRHGFSLENRPYRPHLTLGRRITAASTFDLDAFSDALPPLSLPVDTIYLMQSTHIQGQLTYLPLLEHPLQPD